MERYLRCSGAVSATPNLRENGQLSDFTDKYLRPDGVFLLRLIEVNFSLKRPFLLLLNLKRYYF